MENIYIQETCVSQEDNIIIGESDAYETFTDDKGTLFRKLQKEYGKCISKMYIDDINGNPKPIGWVFQRKQEYDDCNEFFTLETWITIMDNDEYLYNMAISEGVDI